ncbi:MAG: alpha/beta hydrolase [Bryobacter sp.]|jgi:acetyl esterase/lipase|nr:alpha/beta hydrolase [Bryobacter sp.]
MSRLLIVFCLAALSFAQRRAPEPNKTELLYPEGAPGAVGAEEVDKPSLAHWLPSQPAAMAVVVCPGGGYGTLAMDHEGVQIAQWLNSQGIAAFVLKYRLGPRYRHPAPLTDAQQALRMVRKLGYAKVGIWGFSAGGHLASTASTHFAGPETRPDFAILAYPVISFTAPYTHQGSRRNLLGDNPDPKLVESLSNEFQVTAQTPPTFLFHTTEDKGVPPENSVVYYLALRKAGVPAEMHIYERGPHGVGLAATDYALASWSARLADWLRRR